MTGEQLFPGALLRLYVMTRRLVVVDDDIVEELTRTQVSYGSARKFAWLSPLTTSKALLNLDLWEEKVGPPLRGVIRYRQDKFTHQVELRSTDDLEAVDARGWFAEAISWGRKQRP